MLQPSTLLQAALLALLCSGVAEATIRAKPRTSYAVARYVPPALLPQGEVVIIAKAHYRLIGAGAAGFEHANAHRNDFAEGFASLFGRVGYWSNMTEFLPSRAAPIHNEGLGSDASLCASLEQSTNSEEHEGIDVVITAGLTRDTLHVEQRGSHEWAYARIISTILQEKGFTLMVLQQKIEVLPGGVHVYKHMPSTALYVEETVLQLRGFSSRQRDPLLPFDSRKQNLLLKTLDSLGLHDSAGIARINITGVRQACSYKLETGHIGLAKVTVVTERDNPDLLFPVALQAVLAKLLEGLVEEGLGVQSIEVLSSRRADNLSVQGQIEALLDPADPVRTFDTRVPAAKLPRYLGDAASTSHSMSWAHPGIWLAVLICIAGSGMVFSLPRGQMPRPSSEGMASPRWILPANWALKLTNTGFCPGDIMMQLDSANAFARYIDEPYAGASAFLQASRLKRAASGGGDPGRGQAAECLLQHRSSPIAASLPHLSAEESQVLAGGEAQQLEKRAQSLERINSLQGWRIAEGDIQICKRADGSDWLLGKGGFGNVYKGLRDGMQEVACKVLHQEDELQEQEFALEMKLQKYLSYDNNLIQFLGATHLNGRPMLVLEYMEGGDLHQALHVPNNRLFWRKQGHRIALDVVRGLAYLHKHSVLHGDLKSRNVLLGRDGAHAKLGDVGMARFISSKISSESVNTMQAQGTFAFAAPELLLGLKCTAKADIFRDLRVPEECPAEIADLIDRCLSFDPKLRPTCQEVFECIQRSMDNCS